jgi:O-antigen biosynthesis protein WbqV
MAGYIPDVDIAIRVVGLRPGEKLREELVAMDEALVASGVDKIQRVQSGWMPELRALQQSIGRLEKLAAEGDARAVLESLYRIVPTFRPLIGPAGPAERPPPRRDRMKRLRIADQSA